MSEFDEILSLLPVEDLAAQLGVSPDEVSQASLAVLPALLGGLQANASDPGGANSLGQALGAHNDSIFGAGLGAIDTDDGAKIVDNIFGPSSPDVAARLGGSSGGSGLIQKLLPMLAPIVMAWLSKKLQEKMAGSSVDSAEPGPSVDSAGSGPSAGRRDSGLPTDMGLPGQSSTPRESPRPAPGQSQSDSATAPQNPMGDILGDILGGALGGATGAGGSSGSAGGSIIDILGGLLGGGRR